MYRLRPVHDLSHFANLRYIRPSAGIIPRPRPYPSCIARTKVRAKEEEFIDNCVIKASFETKFIWSSYKEFMVDDLAAVGDEGRGKQRYAPESRKQALTRRFPNGATLLE